MDFTREIQVFDDKVTLEILPYTPSQFNSMVNVLAAEYSADFKEEDGMLMFTTPQAQLINTWCWRISRLCGVRFNTTELPKELQALKYWWENYGRKRDYTASYDFYQKLISQDVSAVIREAVNNADESVSEKTLAPQ